jgi:hypothetical protein
MTALVQATIARHVMPISDFGVVALFSLLGLTVSLFAVHVGWVIS